MSEETTKQDTELGRVDESSIAFAASRLMQEPEQSEPPVKEPEETAEQVEEKEDVVEETMSESQTTDPGDDDEEDEEDLPLAAEAPEESEEEVPDSEDEAEGKEEELEYYLIKVDGEEIEVTLDELRSGYQRQKDYTKKTQTVAEQRKELEAKATELQSLQENFMIQAQLANELLNRDLKEFEKVDWDTLKQEDPVTFVQKQIEVQDVKQRQAELQQQAIAVHEHNIKVQQEEAQKYLEEQRKVALGYFPEWKNQKNADEHQMQLIEYAKGLGVPEQKLASIMDATDLLILDKARKYDEIESKKRNISEKQKAPAIRKRVRSKGAAPKGTNRKKAIAEKQGQLRKSGSLRDAAALMEELRHNKVINKRG